MSREKIANLASMDPSEFTNYIRLRNWKRNSQLIDFREIPEDIIESIEIGYSGSRPRQDVNIQYLIDNNIQELIEEFS